MNILTPLIILMVAIATTMPQQVIGFKPKEKANKNALANAKLVMTMKSDEVLTRTARGSVDPVPEAKIPDATGAADSKSGSGGDKRAKHGGNGGSRKFNRNQDFNHAAGGGRKSHADKRPSNSGEHVGKRQQLLPNRQQHRQQQHQLLKSQQQQHLEHQHTQENKRKHNNQKHDEQELIGGSSKSQSTCRYTKSAWSDCDRKTNTHSRTLTLKKGDTNCLPTRTIQKKCKKSCRYDKGAWSECKDGEMTRVDNLKTAAGANPTAATPASSAAPAASASCEPTRTINRKCNPERNGRKSSKGQHNNNNNNNNNGSKSNKKERKNKDKETKHQPA